MPWTLRAAEAARIGRQLVVDGLDQGHPVAEGGQRLPGLADRGRVGVDADQGEAGVRGQQRAGVAGAAEGRVHQDGAGGLERGSEQREDPVLQDRQVTGACRVWPAHRAPLARGIIDWSLCRLVP